MNAILGNLEQFMQCTKRTQQTNAILKQNMARVKAASTRYTDTRKNDATKNDATKNDATKKDGTKKDAIYRSATCTLRRIPTYTGRNFFNR